MVGEGQGVSLEVIRRGYIYMTWREAGVAAPGHRGKSNVMGTKYGSRIVQVTK